MAFNPTRQVVPLTVTPSLLYGNLATNGSQLAFAHRSEVFVLDEACTNGGSAPVCTSVPLRGRGDVLQVAWCALNSGTYLVVASVAGFQVFDSSLSRPVFEHTLELAPDSATFARGICNVEGMDRICVGTAAGEVVVLDLTHGAFVITEQLRGHAAPISALGASARFLLTCDDTGMGIAWDARTLERVATLAAHDFPCTGCAVRGESAVVAYASGLVQIFRLPAGRLLAAVAAHSRCINALTLHPTRDWFVTVGDDSHVNVWSLPDFSSKSSTTVDVVASVVEPDRVLTGAVFCRTSSGSIAVAAYDSPMLFVYPAHS